MTGQSLAIPMLPTRWQETNAQLPWELLGDGAREIWYACPVRPTEVSSHSNEAGQEIPEPDAFCPINEVTWEDGGS